MNRYENYLETGFEWIGKIPYSWGLARVGKFFTERSEKVDDVTYPPLSVTMNGIVDQLSDVAKSNDNDNRKLVKKDDFVINSRSDRKGSSGIAPRDGSVSLINIVLAPKNIDPKYIENLFKSYYFKEEYFRNGKGIHWDLWTTRWEQFKNINIPIPPIEEQKLISRYLDKKTSQIDSLVEKIQKKIEILKEQRTSLINQYVTKGLDPNVEMKDSGVEWIGEIPKHWEVSRIKYIHQQKIDSFIDGDWIESPYITDHGIRYITTGNIGEGVFKFQGNSFISQDTFDELKCSEVFPGDLVISRLSPPVGRSCIIPDLGHRIVTSVDNVIVRLRNDLSIYYYNYLFNSARSFENTSTLSRGTTLIRISRTMLGNIETLIPPVDEQNEIVSYLDQRLKPLEKLEENEHNRIALLKEYRQSLISSVVTGKVRVTEDMI